MEEKGNETNVKRHRFCTGNIYEIHIKDYFVYAQAVPSGNVAIFDKQFKTRITDISELLYLPVLYDICVYSYVFNQGIWPKVGKLPVRPELRLSPLTFIQDPVKKVSFELYNSNTGKIYPCKREDIIGLDRCAVWGENHVEDRIDAYYNHKPCDWLRADYELLGHDIY